MTRAQLAAVVREELARLAPEADLAALPPQARLREELDLDSFDFARFVTAIDERLGIDVPELDYRRLETLRGCIEYLLSRLEAAGARGAP